jgi:hypothetical protein
MSERVRARAVRYRWQVLVVVTALALTALSVLPATAANLTGSSFETDDGNTVVNTAGNLDWDNVAAVVKNDAPSGQNDNSFGNGTKEDTAVPSVVSGSIPPNKSDLKEFGSYIEDAANGKQYLHLFWTRVQDPTGTTNMDFEFNEKICTVDNTSGCSANGVTPVRTAGDLLITYDLSRGGTQATISLRTWDGSKWGPASSLDPTKATGSINTQTINTNINNVAGSYSARTFGEASINLTDTIFDPSSCKSFGGAYLKSRSSDSFTSALKDFIAPIGIDLTNCGRVVVHKVDDSSNALDGAAFSISPATKGTPPATTLTRVAAGVYCAEDLLLNTEYTITETQAPTGYDKADPDFQTFTPTQEGTCGTVTSSTTADLTFVNTAQKGTVNIHKQDDAATPAALSGAVFTLYADNAPQGGTRGAEDTATSFTCTTNASGDCSITDVPLGRYWVVETTTPAGHSTAADQNITLTVNNRTVSLTFTNPRQFTVIVLVCKKGASDTLHQSSVSFDGGQTTLDSLASAPAGLTDAQLCGLGGARLSPTGKGNKTATISIP